MRICDQTGLRAARQFGMCLHGNPGHRPENRYLAALRSRPTPLGSGRGSDPTVLSRHHCLQSPTMSYARKKKRHAVTRKHSIEEKGACARVERSERIFTITSQSERFLIPAIHSIAPPWLGGKCGSVTASAHASDCSAIAQASVQCVMSGSWSAARTTRAGTQSVSLHVGFSLACCVCKMFHCVDCCTSQGAILTKSHSICLVSAEDSLVAVGLGHVWNA